MDFFWKHTLSGWISFIVFPSSGYFCVYFSVGYDFIQMVFFYSGKLLFWGFIQWFLHKSNIKYCGTTASFNWQHAITWDMIFFHQDQREMCSLTASQQQINHVANWRVMTWCLGEPVECIMQDIVPQEIHSDWTSQFYSQGSLLLNTELTHWPEK